MTERGVEVPTGRDVDGAVTSSVGSSSVGEFVWGVQTPARRRERGAQRFGGLKALCGILGHRHQNQFARVAECPASDQSAAWAEFADAPA